MSSSNSPLRWWGAPKKFDTNFRERKISWLELFYDLVYVIAISKITHHLAAHLSLAGFFDYAYMFMLIFWGWLNGSLYHDLHGGAGLRTRLMTLWQMMIIAALSISIEQTGTQYFRQTTIVFMLMQLFITYQWWSVGFYDKEHRKYNKPYTILYLIAFFLLGASLFLPANYAPMLMPLVILFNYIPPFIATVVLRKHSLSLSLSASMSERLGLFTIIVLGEVVLGVINGITKATSFTWLVFGNFALALSVVFALWWLFFTLASDRQAKEGFVNASFFQMLYIPMLMSLGFIAVAFSLWFKPNQVVSLHGASVQQIFGCALAVYFTCISLMMGLLHYPPDVQPIKKRVRLSLLVTALIFFVFALIFPETNSIYCILLALIIVISEILYLNSLYYKFNPAEAIAVDSNEVSS